MRIKKIIKNVSITRIIMGIIMGAFGIYSFMNPESTLKNLGIAFALYALVTGIIDCVMYFVFENRVGFAPSIALISGIVSIVAGFMMFLNPTSTSIVIGMLFPLWFMANCFGRIAQLPLVKMYNGTFSYWVSLILTVFGIFLSFYLLANPLESIAYTLMYVSVYLIFNGCSLVIDGITGYSFTKRLD